jgi:hypothetical protein
MTFSVYRAGASACMKITIAACPHKNQNVCKSETVIKKSNYPLIPLLITLIVFQEYFWCPELFEYLLITRKDCLIAFLLASSKF